ncbi:MAG: hypothetical protein ACO1PZ_02525 [Gammaproteobacteria bacterium]
MRKTFTQWLAQRLRQRAYQRQLAVGLLTLAFGCFAQALWVGTKAELAQAFADPSNAALTWVACYMPGTAQQDVASR